MSDQRAEIRECLAAAVQRANANLVFVNGFPEAERKNQWLASALTVELNEHRKESTTIAAVDDRAKNDKQYFSRLLSMVICLDCDDEEKTDKSPQITGRWSGFRQNIINMARSLINSQESTYGLWRDPSERVDLEEVRQAARDILSGDAYHFGKTAAVSTYTADRVVPSEPQYRLGRCRQVRSIPTSGNVRSACTFL